MLHVFEIMRIMGRLLEKYSNIRKSENVKNVILKRA